MSNHEQEPPPEFDFWAGGDSFRPEEGVEWFIAKAMRESPSEEGVVGARCAFLAGAAWMIREVDRRPLMRALVGGMRKKVDKAVDDAAQAFSDLARRRRAEAEAAPLDPCCLVCGDAFHARPNPGDLGSLLCYECLRVAEGLRYDAERSRRLREDFDLRNDGGPGGDVTGAAV